MKSIFGRSHARLSELFRKVYDFFSLISFNPAIISKTIYQRVLIGYTSVIFAPED
jgi:hypothetical protein